MVHGTIEKFATLYDTDETAWLEITSELVRSGRWDEVDTDILAEYLTDMARRDRREVETRLTLLITHALKWFHQVDRRSGSWRATIIEQRQELEGLIGRGVLRNHAEDVLAEVFLRAVERTVAETGLPRETFPTTSPYSLNQLLTPSLLDEELLRLP